MNPNNKNWMRVGTGFVVCNIGFSFHDSKTIATYTLQQCLDILLIHDNDSSFIYIDHTKTVTHILTMKEAKRLLKLSSL